MNYGEIFCALRKKRGLNQSDVADYLGITRGAYGMYEIGRRKIDVDTLVKLCRFFEVTPNEVLGFEECSKGARSCIAALRLV